MLCRSIRNGTVRRTTVGCIRAVGGWLVQTSTPGGPPFHCDLGGLTPAAFDAILGPEGANQCRRRTAGEVMLDRSSARRPDDITTRERTLED